MNPDTPMNDWKENEYTRYTFSDQFDRDMEAFERVESLKESDGDEKDD